MIKWNKSVTDNESARKQSESIGVPVVIKQEGEYLTVINAKGDKRFYQLVK
jgi:hypothetical protein